jgi:Fe-S-cluster-containing hydrogenase component 2
LRIARDTEVCRGCRTCELVCSWHFHKVFSPELSSIKISKNNRTMVIVWSIDSTCDSCKGESHPLCVAYCPFGALKEAK